MNQLEAPCKKTRHGFLFAIPGCELHLMLNEHNNGKKHLPSYCINDFRDRMVELGLYELDEDHEND